MPYLITEQAKNEQATPQQRNAVQRLIEHIVRAVKGWVVRTLSKYDTTYNMSRRVAESLTPADILYMAERMVGEVAKRGGDNNNRPKFSKTEQSQFDQLLAKADKMIAEQGKLLAPNGKPSKLNRYQWGKYGLITSKIGLVTGKMTLKMRQKWLMKMASQWLFIYQNNQEFYILEALKKKATDSDNG